MIRELKLSNFRIFEKEVTVRFRPITIFIGKNNAGKSSIIKFLLMLKQSTMNTRSFLAANGDDVDLGGFYELKNKNKRIPDLTFSLQVGEGEGDSPADAIYKFRRKYYEKNNDHAENMKNTYEVNAAITYNKEDEFLGKSQTIIFRIGDESFLEGESAISPNSTFLDSVGKLDIRLFSPNKKMEEQKTDRTINDTIKYCIEKIRYDIQSTEHLSAAREELEGFFSIYSTSPSKHVGKMGEDTIFQLQKEGILNDPKKKELLIKHTKQVLGVDDIHLKEWSNEFVTCSAKNVSGKAKINISNFGFGVSQCLPVFVQGLLMSPRSQLIVEQPEAQVHPTAQIRMGSFFVDLWNKRKVGSIIETHSDNLILGIHKHIAKGDISEKDVSIAYFAMEEEIPIVKNLDLYDNGTMQEGLPMEFFGGNLIETLKIGASDYEDE